MKCNFCSREVPKGTEECPYCHYRFEQEATILNPRERDEFEGVTIDESGYEENAAGNNGTRSPEYRQTYEYRSEEYSGARSGRGPKIYVKNLGCGGGLLTALLVICVLIGLFIFFMPLFVIIAGIGLIYYFISSFLG